MRPKSIRPLAVAATISTALPVHAFDVNDKFSISGALAAGGQCQMVTARLPSESYDDDGSLNEFDNTCGGAVPLTLEVSFRPNEVNEFLVKLGFAAGNGINDESPWILAPWAANLEDDVKDINGRNRDYLLAAWYKHTFTLENESSLGATIGIIDSTDYLDGNLYANDENTQFMNEVFVNNGSYGLPSFDIGGAVEWSSGPWGLNAMLMNVGENDDGENYNFWGLQGSYRVDNDWGSGNYRLILTGASSKFLDPTGTSNESRFAGGISFDQELNDRVGAFLRLGWQTDDAAVDYRSLYSGGLNIAGSTWGRESDNIGVGYAYLEGGNTGVDSTHVFETYYRYAFNDHLGITADAQYMKDKYSNVDSNQKDPAGWILGLRLVAEF